MVKLPHPKHTNVLLDICHHHTDSNLFSKVEFKLNNGTFQNNSIMVLCNPFMDLHKSLDLFMELHDWFMVHD